jgi:hypothetical protein
MTSSGNPDLMQTARGRAKAAVSIAQEVLKVQDDPLEVIGIAREGVQGFRVVARVKDRLANFGRKAVDVLRVVTIFRVHPATFRRRLSAHEYKHDEHTAASYADHGLASVI